MNKRAVSPLLATAILLSISIGLGVVVMSWGEEYVSEHATFAQKLEEVPKTCTAINFNIFSALGESELCWRNGFLSFIIDNGPQIAIEDILIRLLGTEGVLNLESLLSKPLEKAHSELIKLNYAGIGNPIQLKVTPKIKTDKEIVYCIEQSKVTPLEKC